MSIYDKNMYIRYFLNLRLLWGNKYFNTLNVKTYHYYIRMVLLWGQFKFCQRTTTAVNKIL